MKINDFESSGIQRRAFMSAALLVLTGCSDEDASMEANSGAGNPSSKPLSTTGQSPLPPATNVTVSDPSGESRDGPFNLPYVLPAAGQARAISLNFPEDIKPAGWTNSQQAYALFGSYGGGAYVPTYSAHGAYVLAGTGGHNHPDNIHAAIFDFSTGLWSHRPVSNAVLDKGAAPYLGEDTNGEPMLEISGTEVPAPAHPYQMLCYMPSGDKGSVVYIMRGAVTSGARPSSYAHRFDLATRTWSRVSAAGDINRGGSEASAVWDQGRGRWWLVPTAMHYLSSQGYLDAADMQWKTTASHPAPPKSAAVYSRLMLHDGMLLRNSGPGSGLRLFDPNSASAGWVTLAVSGALPIGQNAWARYSDGKWYAYDGFSGNGNTLTRITPPADPKQGTWVVDSVTVAGDSLPPSTSGSTKHYTRLFFVPALDCLCWIPGAKSAVYLVKPS